MSMMHYIWSRHQELPVLSEVPELPLSPLPSMLRKHLQMPRLLLIASRPVGKDKSFIYMLNYCIMD